MAQSSLVCDAWGGPHAPPAFSRPVGSTVRTLFMSAEFDSSTPPAWARSARRRFPRSQQVNFGGLSHATLLSLCGQQVAASFLAAPDRRPDTSCVTPLGRIPFATAP